MKSASLNSKSAHLLRLGELSARHPDLPPLLTREMALRGHRYMKGVKLYQDHPAHRSPETSQVIWRAGSTMLRDFAPGARNAPIVLVVPSLINRFTILDLAPHHSFVRVLVDHGLRPLVIDWDRPDQAEAHFSLSDYITKRLMPALHIAGAGQPVHILGYCMGGLLTLALALLCPAQTRTLSLLATPWDFHAGFDAAGHDGRKLEEKLTPWLRSESVIPVEVLQSVFTAFQPFHALRKFSSFFSYDQQSTQATLFTLTEDWLNDGVPLSVPAARECFGEWCARNAIAHGRWQVGATVIDPGSLQAPAYVVVPGKDRIVPPESAMPLARAIHGAMRHEPMMGHIGIMASPAAPHQVWKPLVGWLEAH